MWVNMTVGQEGVIVQGGVCSECRILGKGISKSVRVVLVVKRRVVGV